MMELFKIIVENCEFSIGRDQHGFWLSATGPIPVLLAATIAIVAATIWYFPA